MTCSECGKDRRAPLTRVCLWCFDLNLLAGGFAAPGLLERWDAVEMEELVAKAVKLKYEREMSQAERRSSRQAEKKLAPAQGSLS